MQGTFILCIFRRFLRYIHFSVSYNLIFFTGVLLDVRVRKVDPPTDRTGGDMNVILFVSDCLSTDLPFKCHKIFYITPRFFCGRPRSSWKKIKKFQNIDSNMHFYLSKSIQNHSSNIVEYVGKKSDVMRHTEM